VEKKGSQNGKNNKIQVKALMQKIKKAKNQKRGAVNDFGKKKGQEMPSVGGTKKKEKQRWGKKKKKIFKPYQKGKKSQAEKK